MEIMSFNIWFQIVYFLASASVGILFNIFQSGISSKNYYGSLHNYFTILSGILFLIALGTIVFYWRDLVNDSTGIKFFELTILIIAIILAIGLALSTQKYLFSKDVFKTSELDPIVNDFTSIADKNEIKLFGGDLNFFGNYPEQMDVNKQYLHLKLLKFKKVLIICETPENWKQKVRYGKILSEIPGTELRFYKPESADLRVRGRMIQVNGVNKLLMYKKIKSGVYKAIETDTADPDGALYNNIWDLVWSLATVPDQREIEEYKSLLKS